MSRSLEFTHVRRSCAFLYDCTEKNHTEHQREAHFLCFLSTLVNERANSRLRIGDQRRLNDSGLTRSWVSIFIIYEKIIYRTAAQLSFRSMLLI